MVMILTRVRGYGPVYLLNRFLSKSSRSTDRSIGGSKNEKNAKKLKTNTPPKASDLLASFVSDQMPRRVSTLKSKQPEKPDRKENVSFIPAEGHSSKLDKHKSSEKSSSPKSIIEPAVLLDAFVHMFSVDRTEQSKGLRFDSKLPEPAALNLFVQDTVHSKGSISSSSTENTSKCPIFDTVESLELTLLSSTAPLNQFEEWLQWTEEGKLWRFPIDNEQDWEEKSVPFHEHTFLEKHLNKELLKCGPLSVFLELVCHGLSQNPYFTVEQKRAHLQWYASYFKDKIPAIEASVKEEQRLAQLERQARIS